MRKILTLALVVGSICLTVWSDPITLQQLFADQKAQDGKILTVSGTVKGYYEKDDFSAFLLIDGGKGCSVYVAGKKALQNEQKVTVTGPFSLSKKIGSRHFSNVIEATDIQPAP